MYAKIVWKRLIAIRRSRKNFQTNDDDEGQKLIRCATLPIIYAIIVIKSHCPYCGLIDIQRCMAWTGNANIVSANLTSKRGRPRITHRFLMYRTILIAWNSIDLIVVPTVK